jgi:hypothetical protein
VLFLGPLRISQLLSYKSRQLYIFFVPSVPLERLGYYRILTRSLFRFRSEHVWAFGATSSILRYKVALSFHYLDLFNKITYSCEKARSSARSTLCVFPSRKDRLVTPAPVPRFFDPLPFPKQSLFILKLFLSIFINITMKFKVFFGTYRFQPNVSSFQET